MIFLPMEQAEHEARTLREQVVSIEMALRQNHAISLLLEEQRHQDAIADLEQTFLRQVMSNSEQHWNRWVDAGLEEFCWCSDGLFYLGPQTWDERQESLAWADITCNLEELVAQKGDQL